MDKLYIPIINSVLFRQTYKGWKIPRRKIGDQELVLIVSGKGKIKIENEIINVKENDLIYFTPEIKHSLWIEKEPFMAFYGIHFHFNDIKERLPLPYVSSLKSTVKLKRLFDELKNSYLSIGYLNTWKLSIMLQTIIMEALNDIYLQTSPMNIVNVNIRAHKSFTVKVHNYFKEFALVSSNSSRAPFSLYDGPVIFTTCT